MATRRQATLYLPAPWSGPIEALRQRFNPRQAALIRAHVTLCREDEVPDWDALAERLRALGTIDVELDFGRPIREGRGGNLVYLAGTGGSFAALRAALLDPPVRDHQPHITLIHPRNGTCTDADFEQLSARYEPFRASFRHVTLIEQIDGGTWRDLEVVGA